MAIITLTTDFGLEDEYVGVMKGSILSVNPLVTLVDITHAITPQDISGAAFMLSYSYKIFPEGTIHLIVVDPGVGSKRDMIVLKRGGHFFVAPNNGVLSLVCHEEHSSDAYRITNERYFRNPISHTFHGRDIMGPVAAHISKGVKLLSIGKKIPKASVRKLTFDTAVYDKKERVIKGSILSFDRFGNILTNIHQGLLENFEQPIKPVIHIGDEKIIGIYESYQSAEQKKPLGIIGSRELLEISINSGSAKDYYSAQKNDSITITASESI